MSTFTDEQKKELAAPLNPKAVKPPAPGKYGDYIEGWWAIAEANRIFGFDGWSRHTELKQLGEPYLKGDKWYVDYMAKVTIDILDPSSNMPIITRQGCGFGQGIDKNVGQAHESALKEAETDAMKRAMMTLGNPFGLALYDKTKANVGDPAAAGRLEEFEEQLIAATEASCIAETLQEYSADLEQLFQQNKAEWNRLSALYKRRRDELTPKKEEADA